MGIRRLYLMNRSMLLPVILLFALRGPHALSSAQERSALNQPVQVVASSVTAGMGIMVGEVTSNSALIQVRLTSADQLVVGEHVKTAGRN